MAYIKDNDQDPAQGSMNVFDSQGQNTSQPQMQGQTQPISVSGGESSNITNQAPAQQAAPKSSGMFKDLRKYVQANQGQAPQLAQAVQKNVQGQAQQIGQQVQQQQQNFQQRVAENQSRLQEAQDFSQQTIQKANQGQAPEEQEIQRFQNLARGQESFGNVGSLGLTSQEAAVKNLEGLTGQAQTARGASSLLKNTFGKDGQTYTKGQQSLDSLLLGRDKGSRQQLVDVTQQAAKSTDQQIRDARQKALTDAAGLMFQNKEFSTNMQNELSGTRQNLEENINTSLEQKQEELRQKRLAFEKGIKSGTLTRDQLNPFLDQNQLSSLEKQVEDSRSKALGRLYLSMGDRDTARGLNVKDLSSLDYYDSKFGNMFDAPQLFDSRNSQVGYAGEASSYAKGVLNSIEDYGLNQADVTNAQLNMKKEIENRTDLDPNQKQTLLKNSNMQAIINLINTKKSQDQIVQDFIARANLSKNAKQYNPFLSNVDESKLTREMFVTDDQLARQRALAALANESGIGIEGKTAAPTAGFNLQQARKI